MCPRTTPPAGGRSTLRYAQPTRSSAAKHLDAPASMLSTGGGSRSGGGGEGEGGGLLSSTREPLPATERTATSSAAAVAATHTHTHTHTRARARELLRVPEIAEMRLAPQRLRELLGASARVSAQRAAALVLERALQARGARVRARREVAAAVAAAAGAQFTCSTNTNVQILTRWPLPARARSAAHSSALLLQRWWLRSALRACARWRQQQQQEGESAGESATNPPLKHSVLAWAWDSGVSEEAAAEALGTLRACVRGRVARRAAAAVRRERAEAAAGERYSEAAMLLQCACRCAQSTVA